MLSPRLDLPGFKSGTETELQPVDIVGVLVFLLTRILYGGVMALNNFMSARGGEVKRRREVCKQSRTNALLRTVMKAPRHQITPVLKSLHWLKVPQSIQCKSVS